MNVHKLGNLLFLLLFCGPFAMAQEEGSFQKEINYNQFIYQVQKHNLEFAAERYAVDIAASEIRNAGISPDPELGFSAFDNGQRRMKMGYGFEAEISKTVELGGKRKARMNLAKSEHELTKYLLTDFFRGLRANATLNFMEAIQNKMLLEVMVNSYESMKQLSESDSIRFALGDIAAIDAKQSYLETQTMWNEVIEMEKNWKLSVMELKLWSSEKITDTFLIPTGDFSKFNRQFNVQTLIELAKEHRIDFKIALQQKDISMKNMQLAKANQKIDLEFSAGVGYESYVSNIVAPTPSVSGVSAGVSIPLKFSNRKNNEWIKAKYEAQQTELLYRQAELQIQNEVTQAFYNYEAHQKQVKNYENGILEDAAAVLEGKVYAYQSGETSLLEVLDAQRTYNEIQQGYYESLFRYGKSLVELENLVGIWDIEF